MNKTVLECSTKGTDEGKKFSAFIAKVSVNGKLNFIEDHYQLSKRFLNDSNELIVPKTRKEAKGRRAVCFEVSGIFIPGDYIDQYFGLLWYKYLKSNLHLENILERYEDYNDIFKPKFGLCQADVIREYMNDENGKKLPKEQRGKSLHNRCMPLIRILNKKDFVMFQEGNLLKAWQELIGHQVNCQCVFNLGFVKQVREAFPKVCEDYLNFSASKSRNLLGQCQIVDTGKKIFGNIFGQYYYGKDGKQYTEYEALEKGLRTLKKYAISNKLQVALPYNIGSGYAGGDWNKVLDIINRVFNDYYVTLYKYNPENENKAKNKSYIEQLSILTTVNE